MPIGYIVYAKSRKIGAVIQTGGATSREVVHLLRDLTSDSRSESAIIYAPREARHLPFGR